LPERNTIENPDVLLDDNRHMHPPCGPAADLRYQSQSFEAVLETTRLTRLHNAIPRIRWVTAGRGAKRKTRQKANAQLHD